jgi:hypothetical protein
VGGKSVYQRSNTHKRKENDSDYCEVLQSLSRKCLQKGLLPEQEGDTNRDKQDSI